MKRVLAPILLMLALGATGALGQGDQCMYADQFFPAGSVSCQNGKQYRCVAGSWQAKGLECADTKADHDQEGLEIDPGRAAPEVRQPGLRDPGVTQPAAPAVPQD